MNYLVFTLGGTYFHYKVSPQFLNISLFSHILSIPKIPSFFTHCPETGTLQSDLFSNHHCYCKISAQLFYISHFIYTIGISNIVSFFTHCLGTLQSALFQKYLLLLQRFCSIVYIAYLLQILENRHFEDCKFLHNRHFTKCCSNIIHRYHKVSAQFVFIAYFLHILDILNIVSLFTHCLDTLQNALFRKFYDMTLKINLIIAVMCVGCKHSDNDWRQLKLQPLSPFTGHIRREAF